MTQKLWTSVDAYIVDTLNLQDPVLDAVLNANAAADLPAFDVAPNQGKFLHLLARIQGAKRILEIGTLGGYSTIWLASALPSDGRLITLEFDPKHAAVAAANIANAGLSAIVEIRVGPALDALAQLHQEGCPPFDIIFIDADKPNNPAYLEWSLRLSRPGAIIIGDNVIRDGQVTNPNSSDPRVRGVRQFIQMMADDPRIDATALQTVGSKGYDGFTLAVVKALPQASMDRSPPRKSVTSAAQITQPMTHPMTRWRQAVLWLTLSCYFAGRLSQLWADRLPSLLIVLLHVVPPAVFALVHGSILYGRKGIAVFTMCCLGSAGFFESLSLRTGFPFGHYYFTDVMGPKVLGLPFLLVLAYLGIGYCSWVLALLVLGYRDQALAGTRAVAAPVLAALIMLAWDLSMDAAWGTIDRAWVWRDGGAFYGVPVSNFFGWYLTAYVFYQTFALYYCAATSESPPTMPRSFWRGPILPYALCAAGNPLLLRLHGIPTLVMDATGRQWITKDILATCAMVSLLVMGPMAVLAWLRLEESDRPQR